MPIIQPIILDANSSTSTICAANNRMTTQQNHRQQQHQRQQQEQEEQYNYIHRNNSNNNNNTTVQSSLTTTIFRPSSTTSTGQQQIENKYSSTGGSGSGSTCSNGKSNRGLFSSFRTSGGGDGDGSKTNSNDKQHSMSQTTRGSSKKFNIQRINTRNDDDTDIADQQQQQQQQQQQNYDSRIKNNRMKRMNLSCTPQHLQPNYNNSNNNFQSSSSSSSKSKTTRHYQQNQQHYHNSDREIQGTSNMYNNDNDIDNEHTTPYKYYHHMNNGTNNYVTPQSSSVHSTITTTSQNYNKTQQQQQPNQQQQEEEKRQMRYTSAPLSRDSNNNNTLTGTDVVSSRSSSTSTSTRVSASNRNTSPRRIRSSSVGSHRVRFVDTESNIVTTTTTPTTPSLRHHSLHERQRKQQQQQQHQQHQRMQMQIQIQQNQQQQQRIPSETIIRSGFLYKLGTNIQQYKRRFFILQQSKTLLYYYMNEHDIHPKGIYDLSNCHIEALLPADTTAATTPQTPSSSYAVSSPSSSSHVGSTHQHNIQDEEDATTIDDDDDVVLNKIDVSDESDNIEKQHRFQQHDNDNINLNDNSNNDNSNNSTNEVSSCQFVIVSNNNIRDKIVIQASTDTIAKEWIKSIKSQQVQSLQQQILTLQNENTVLNNTNNQLQIICRSIQHIENDRDNAINDILLWKQQYEQLHTSLHLLNNHIHTKVTLISTTPTANDNVGTTTTVDNTDDKKEEVNIQNDENKDSSSIDDTKNPHNISLLDQDDVVVDDNPIIIQPIETVSSSEHDDNNTNDDDNDIVKETLNDCVNYKLLYNTIKQLLIQYETTKVELDITKTTIQTKDEQLTLLQNKMNKAEKYLCEIWEENCSIRKVLKQTKRDKRVLVREVKNLISSIQKQEQQQQNNLQQRQQEVKKSVLSNKSSSMHQLQKMSNQQITGTTTTTSKSTDGSIDTDDEQGQRIIDKLEKHLLSSIRLNEQLRHPTIAKLTTTTNITTSTGINSNRRNRTLSPPQRRRLAAALAATNTNTTGSNNNGSSTNHTNGQNSQQQQQQLGSHSVHSIPCLVTTESSNQHQHQDQPVSELDTSIETSFDHDDDDDDSKYPLQKVTRATPLNINNDVNSSSVNINVLDRYAVATEDEHSNILSMSQSTTARTLSSIPVPSLVDDDDSSENGSETDEKVQDCVPTKQCRANGSQHSTNHTITVSKSQILPLDEDNGSDIGSNAIVSSIIANASSVDQDEELSNTRSKNRNYDCDFYDSDIDNNDRVQLEGNVIILNGEEIQISNSKEDRFDQQRQRPNPLLLLDGSYDDDNNVNDRNGDNNRKNEELINHTSATRTQHNSNDYIPSNRATTKLTCPLADVVSTSKNTEQNGIDLQPYHLTFTSRRIGIQFMKVPFESMKHSKGLLTDAIKSDLTTKFNTNDTVDYNEKQQQEHEQNITCNVICPVDAVLVCGFHGFDDTVVGNIRPQLGAKLIAFDNVSVEVGKWTFNSIKKAIQAQDRPLTLSFRNDYLTTVQRTLLTRAISTTPTTITPNQIQSINQYKQHNNHRQTTGSTSSSKETNFSTPNVVNNKNNWQRDYSDVDDTSSIHESLISECSGSRYSSNRVGSFLPSSFSGKKTTTIGNNNNNNNNKYYSSFSDAGTTTTTNSTATSVLSSVVPTLISNILRRSKNIQLKSSRSLTGMQNNNNDNNNKNESTTQPSFTPNYLSRTPTAVEGTPQHQDFQSELL